MTLHAGAGYRIGYAISRLVITRTDKGGEAANWPGIVGPLLAESLANSYLPVQEQTAGVEPFAGTECGLAWLP